MLLPIHRSYIMQLSERLNTYFHDNLTFEAIAIPNKGWFVKATRPGEEAGLLFHWEELDNGAGGWKENALRQLIGLRDGTPWEPVPVTQRVYTDVMTIGNNDGVGEPVE